MPNDAARKYSAKMKTSQKCYETMMKLWMLSKKFFPFQSFSVKCQFLNWEGIEREGERERVYVCEREREREIAYVYERERGRGKGECVQPLSNSIHKSCKPLKVEIFKPYCAKNSNFN